MSLQLPVDIRQNFVDIPDLSTMPEVTDVQGDFSRRPDITVLLLADWLCVTKSAVPLQHFCDSVTLIFANIIIIILIWKHSISIYLVGKTHFC